jgi:hypothetical protein
MLTTPTPPAMEPQAIGPLLRSGDASWHCAAPKGSSALLSTFLPSSHPHHHIQPYSLHIHIPTSPHSITLRRPSLLTRTPLDTNSANLSFFYRRNTVGNLNGQNGTRTTAAQISTSFVKCIKEGLCRSRSKNTSRRRRPSCQILRPRCRKPLMSSIHVLVCEPRAYIPSSSLYVSIKRRNCSLIPIDPTLSDLDKPHFINGPHLLELKTLRSSTRRGVSNLLRPIAFKSSVLPGLIHISYHASYFSALDVLSTYPPYQPSFSVATCM